MTGSGEETVGASHEREGGGGLLQVVLMHTQTQLACANIHMELLMVAEFNTPTFTFLPHTHTFHRLRAVC